MQWEQVSRLTPVIVRSLESPVTSELFLPGVRGWLDHPAALCRHQKKTRAHQCTRAASVPWSGDGLGHI
eukprot:15458008-Alexandrium_andersonii.AAC.1